jgi:uncharacterized membrane protein
MVLMALAAALWMAIHMLGGGPLRPGLVAKLGEIRFRSAFSAASVVSIVFLTAAYNRAPFELVYLPLPGGRELALLLMPLAFILLVCSLDKSNATLAGPDMLPGFTPQAVGIARVTRHPMLSAFAIWAGLHLLNNGDVASILLFGSVLAVAIRGMASIDHKRQQKWGPVWEAYAAQTSRIPFAAILAGRTNLKFGEIGLARIAAGLALYVGGLWLHGQLIGWPPVG